MKSNIEKIEEIFDILIGHIDTARVMTKVIFEEDGKMRERIQDMMDKIAEDQDIDIDKLSPQELDKLYSEAEAKVFNNLADMREGMEDR